MNMESVKKNFKIYLSLGSNLGNRIQNLENAVDQIRKKIGEIRSISSYYETESWGFDSENKFVNIALIALTELSPENLLDEIHKIENLIGRDRTVVKAHEMDYFDRIIDIDIIHFEDEARNNEKLTIPHAKFSERNFVLIPLQEIDPEFVHPSTNQGVEELIELCNDDSQIRKILT